MRPLSLLFFIFFAVWLIFTTSNAKATEPQRWVGVPLFYTTMVPKVADCTYDETATYGHCGWKGYPEEATVGLTTVSESPVIEVINTRLYTEVTCVKGVCKTQFGQPVGEVTDKGVSYWTLPTGFYLTELNGKITAVKFGNGPKAKTYPIRDVLLLPEYKELPDGFYIPEETERLAFDAYCNPGNECSYMGKVINYASLNKYVPKRRSMDCDEQFCYINDNEVIGLNPRS